MRYLRIIASGLLGGWLLLSSTWVYSEDDGVPKVDAETQKKINEAIKKGTDFLLKKGLKGREVELEVLTLLHAGLDPKKNNTLAEAINKLANANLQEVYRTALGMMALELADRYKYQYKIAEMAQALVDYQCENGQWDYPCRYHKNNVPRVTGENAELREIVSGESSKPGTAPKPLKKIEVKRKLDPKKRGKDGDNSNTQFALMGLRAAARCGVVIPEETWRDAANWLEKNQGQDGGWGYARGKHPDNTTYGSMTCAGLCGLAIAKFYLKQDIANDSSIKKGVDWLGQHLVFDRNPNGGPPAWLYYYIYGIERVGAVLGIRNMGSHEWYSEGVKYLLPNQNEKDGSWNTSGDDSMVIANTCFAILFLKLATPSLKLKAKLTGEEPPKKEEEK